jgi:hypothetical protein
MYSFDPSVNLGGIELNSFRLPQPGKYAFENIAKTENTSPSTVDKGDSFERILNIMLDPTRRKQALEDTLEFQNRQQAAAAPYNMLYKGLDTLSKLPEQISGRAADRAMNIVLGARNATEAYNQAAASYPRTNFQSTASPVQRNYFT